MFLAFVVARSMSGNCMYVCYNKVIPPAPPPPKKNLVVLQNYFLAHPWCCPEALFTTGTHFQINATKTKAFWDENVKTAPQKGSRPLLPFLSWLPHTGRLEFSLYHMFPFVLVSSRLFDASMIVVSLSTAALPFPRHPHSLCTITYSDVQIDGGQNHQYDTEQHHHSVLI